LLPAYNSSLALLHFASQDNYRA